ncbi:MAG: L-allo-threonine dehydrogenase, NAD(P)-binding [Frankiales bacterium]|nr:L-allo-threonine dehydrogenase, NAD(P)-binding [Frankiales bacterium]
MARKLEGKVALVTGASSGIGEATAIALAAEGAAVAIAARRTERLEALRAKLEAGGARVFAVPLDVTDEASADTAVEQAVAELGRLDIVINNAGVMLLGPIVDADTEDWRRMINTNVLGVMYVTHAALPHLLKEGGDLVQMSSVAGRMARVGSGAYNASKWAVNAFSESLRQEVTSRGVRVTLIEPGAVATELQSHITHPGAKAALEKRLAEMRPLQAVDIANAVLYSVTQPPHVSINEILVRPTDQEQ